MVDRNESTEKSPLQDYEAFQDILEFSSTKNSVSSYLSTEINVLLPAAVTAVTDQWNSSTASECPWVKHY